jgi:hypothetical protein
MAQKCLPKTMGTKVQWPVLQTTSKFFSIAVRLFLKFLPIIILLLYQE